MFSLYQTGTPLTYYNCYHPEGITIDGVDDGDQDNRTMCHWEFVTGQTGTYLRALDLEHDLRDEPGKHSYLNF